MQIQNPTDQQAIRESVEAAGEAVLSELPGLTPGQAILSGDSMNTPVLIRVRERHTDHGAESVDATDEWQKAYDDRKREPSRSEGADFGGGESDGYEEL